MSVDIVQDRYHARPQGNIVNTQLNGTLKPSHMRLSSDNEGVLGYAFNVFSDNIVYVDGPDIQRPAVATEDVFYMHKPEERTGHDDDNTLLEDDSVALHFKLKYGIVDENEQVVSDEHFTYFAEGSCLTFGYNDFKFPDDSDFSSVITLSFLNSIFADVIGTLITNDEGNEIGLIFNLLRLRLPFDEDDGEEEKFIQLKS